MAIQKHLFAGSHPENGAYARRSRPFDDPGIAQVFGKEIVKVAQHIRVDKENRPARCYAYAGKIFWSAGTRVHEICFDSVTNVGTRPTFADASFAIESHLLNFHPIELQPETPLEQIFLKRIRSEIKFPSVDALREQIAKDVHKARKYFRIQKELAASN